MERKKFLGSKQTQFFAHQRFTSLVMAIGLVVTVVVVGTIGYRLIEGWSYLDSLYMTIITLATVGFREVDSLSHAGMIFTIGLIITGVGTAAYTFTLLTQIIVEGELQHFRGRYRMQKKIRTYRDHTIVCGYGRLARIIVPELLKMDHQIVVVEREAGRILELEFLGCPFVEGNAYEDETLKMAGIEHARNLLALLPADADNVYVTLCARDLNPKLQIIARSEGLGGESRLKRAGANQVLSPYRISASRIVQQMTRPNVTSFLELAAASNNAPLAIEELLVPEKSAYGGKTLEESELRTKTGVIIAAFIDRSGKMNFNPGRESVIEPGSTMIVLGEPNSLSRLSELLLE